MHFVIGANTVDSRVTGMGRQMHGMAQGLVHLGHTVELCFAGSVEMALPRRMARLEFPFRLARYVAQSAHSRKGDVVCVLHEPVAWATAAFVRGNVRTYAMVHSAELKSWKIERHFARATGLRIRRGSRIVYPATQLTQDWLSLRLAHGVFCLSSEDVRYLCGRLGLQRWKVHRIDNGVEEAFLGLPAPGPRRPRDLLFMGSWLPRKGIRFLTAALEQVGNPGGVWTLTLAGTGRTAEEILGNLPAAWRSSTVVRPIVNAEELIPLYQEHRIFVLPSVDEGIPLSMLEAMASGLCPVVSAVGGIPDVVTHDRDGILLPPAEPAALAGCLRRLLGAPEEVLRVARNAHARAQSLSWGSVGKQVEQHLGSQREDA